MRKNKYAGGTSMHLQVHLNHDFWNADLWTSNWRTASIASAWKTPVALCRQKSKETV